MEPQLVDLLRQGSALLDAVARLLDERDRAADHSAEVALPITSWKAAAVAVGVSEDTLLRRRQQHGVRVRKPWFASAEDCRVWYAALGRPVEAAPARPMQRRGMGLTLAEFRRQAKNR